MDVVALASGLVSTDVAACDRRGVEAVLTDVGRLVSWAEQVRVAAARRLNELADASPSILPAEVLAGAGRIGRRDADQTLRREEALTLLPAVESALAAGELGAGHVDVVARALRSLEADDRTLLATSGEWIAQLATRCTPDELGRRLRQRINHLRTDDGVARFERQRRATRLRHWIDRDTGMVCVHGEFDPETGLSLVGRLRSMVERLFHDAAPPTCPGDPEARQHHLNALALVALCAGRGGVGSAPELSIVIDQRTLAHGVHETSRLDSGLPVELPVDTVRRLGCIADIVPVVVDPNGVVLQVGRAQRLANRHQRRALRAMYPTCAIPGCFVRFDHCQPHHILWWRHGGGSDLSNLLPLCSRHHHAVHEGGWVLELDSSTRSLRVVQPDGTVLATGPPGAAT
jgi:hypothetical protein